MSERDEMDNEAAPPGTTREELQAAIDQLVRRGMVYIIGYTKDGEAIYAAVPKMSERH